MDDWMGELISRCLSEIPRGKYRDRTERELRDHMETMYLSLTEDGMEPGRARDETLRAMGEPDKLREEYRAAWQRSMPRRMEHRLKTWGWGCVLMFAAHLLVSGALGIAWNMAILLPGDSQNQWIRLIRDTVGDMNNSMFCCYLLPLVLALMVGAHYLSREFQVSRHPAWQVSVGLLLHWAACAMTQCLPETCDGPLFWEQLQGYFSYNAVYYSLTFGLCLLLGAAFGHMSARRAAVLCTHQGRK